MGKMEMMDTFGVPEFFADHIGAIEDVGNGMIRVIKCVRRQGTLIPVYSFICPATMAIHNDGLMRTFALRMVQGGDRAH